MAQEKNICFIKEKDGMRKFEKDGLIFNDPENPTNKIIFNFYSWAEIVRANIVRYGHKSYEEACEILHKDNLYTMALDSYMDVALTAHELEYHWAMLLVYGNCYWSDGKLSYEEPLGHLEWIEKYRKEHNLAEDSFIFNNEEPT